MIELALDAVAAAVSVFLKASDRAAEKLNDVFRTPGRVDAEHQPAGAGSHAGAGGLSHDDYAEPVGEYPDLAYSDVSLAIGAFMDRTRARALAPRRSIPDVLDAVVTQLAWAYQGRVPAVVRDLQAEVRDVAAQFRADELTNN